jgi:hypothetical protein
LEEEGRGWKRCQEVSPPRPPSLYRLTAGAEIPALGAEFLAPGISGLSYGISGGRKFNVSAQISGANFRTMYCKVHHFGRVHGGMKICYRNKGFHPLGEFYHLNTESPSIPSRTEIKQEIDLCVRRKVFRDREGIG